MKCISTPTQDQQCSDLANTGKCCFDILNQVACLSMPNVYCKFYKQNFFILDKKAIDVANGSSLVPEKYHLSPNVMDYFNRNIFGSIFIYDAVRLQLLISINQVHLNILLYVDQFRLVNKDALRRQWNIVFRDYQTANKVKLGLQLETCISINALCKFQGGKFVPIAITDADEKLIKDQDFKRVSPQICAQFPTPYNNNTLTYSCLVVTLQTEVCSALGLSKSACLTYTLSSFCIFDAANFKCTSTNDNLIPCFLAQRRKFLKVVQQLGKMPIYQNCRNYCQFIMHGDSGEFLEISINLLTGLCLEPDAQTNQITCRRATNQVCFYNQITKNVLLELQCNAMMSWFIIQQISLFKVACSNQQMTQLIFNMHS
ncbi:unnamed protein product [Paramecium octaurelia]|uniref:Uncharacterized protein n=1 Tax=Paramecium octaurelia TaxID=43137 RepID=A0A8S1XU16_PAROT|nr:unnamed protein product [Paramecium octaurelia]